MSLIPARRSSAMATRDPFVQLQNEMNQWFDRLTRSWGLPELGRDGLAPAMDMEENDSAYVLHLEVPGVSAKDMTISVEDGVLVITGEKHNERREQTRRVLTEERFYGRFYREIALPVDADLDHLTASIKQGILTVTVPKTASATRRTIEIEGE